MKQFKRIAGIFVFCATIAVFVYYWHTHPELLDQLKNTRPAILVRIMLLYACATAVLVLVYDTTLRLCKTSIPLKEHTLLTIYSSIVNFFGPLQSGPGFRSIYLKKKHNVSLQYYASITLIYYGFFAIISGMFLLSGSPKLFALAVMIGLLAAGVGYIYAVRRWPKVTQRFLKKPTLRLVARLGFATLLQVIFITCIYLTELHIINPSITVGQAIIYTGAANFALFVSLTPGALGFRESFLFFSQRLHHIDGQTIIAANIIDRSVYVAFLGLLFVGTLAVHAKDKLGVKNLEP